MKRVSFLRTHKIIPRERSPLVALVLSVNSGPSEREPVSAPKERPRRNEQYRRWVATLPCAACARPGPSQAAHADYGKGFGIKSGDDTCYPLCADVPGWRGCHSGIGAAGMMTKEERREFEVLAAAQTQCIAKAHGEWPKEWD